MDFEPAIQEQLAGRLVRCDALVEFRFVSETVRVWNGFGPLQTIDGRVWSGLAEMGRISGLAQAINGKAPAQSFTLSGVDSTFAAKARADSAEYENRPVLVYLQFFDEKWACLGAPVALSFRFMGQITASMSQGDNGPVYAVTITAETPFTNRRRPSHAYNTDRDQQSRHPGDRGMERAAGIDNKQITFPDY